MAITVPYEQQVSPDTPQTPHLPSPSLNPEAYGTTVASSQAGIGETLKNASEQLANHAIERLNEQRTMDSYKGEMDLRDVQNNLMYGTDSITVKDANGNDVQRQVGRMNWMRDDAKGAFQSFLDARKPYVDNYINSAPTIQERSRRAMLAANLGKFNDEMVTRHEAQEYKASVVDNSNRVIHSDNALIAAAKTSNDVAYLLNHSANQVTLAHDSQGLRGSAIHKNALDVNNYNQLKTNLLTQIDSDPTGQNARRMLNSFNPNGDGVNIIDENGNKVNVKISNDNYLKLEKDIQDSVKNKQAQAREQAALKAVNSRIDSYQQLGALLSVGNLKDAQLMVGDLMKTDPTSGAGLQAVIDAKGNFAEKLPEWDIAGKAVLSGLDSFDKSQDKVGLTDALNDYLTSRGNKLTTKESAIMIQAMVDFNQVKPTVKGGFIPNILKDIQNVGAIKKLMDISKQGSISITNALDTYFKQTQNNTSPKDAVDNAVKNELTKNNPSVALMDRPPSVVVNKGSSTRYFIGKETDTSKFPYIYDEASKMVVPNKDYKDKRPKEQ